MGSPRRVFRISVRRDIFATHMKDVITFRDNHVEEGILRIELSSMGTHWLISGSVGWRTATTA